MTQKANQRVLPRLSASEDDMAFSPEADEVDSESLVKRSPSFLTIL